MARQPFFIKLTHDEAILVENYMNQVISLSGLRARRRVQAILLSHQRWTIQRIAKHLKVNRRSVWKWFKAYKEKGLAGLRGKYFSHRL